MVAVISEKRVMESITVSPSSPGGLLVPNKVSESIIVVSSKSEFGWAMGCVRTSEAPGAPREYSANSPTEKLLPSREVSNVARPSKLTSIHTKL